MLDDDARLGPMLSSVRCSLFPTAPARACRLSAHFAACNLVTPTPVAVAGLHHLQRLRGNLNRFALLPLARVLPGPVGTAWSVLFHRGVSVNVGTTSVDSSVSATSADRCLPSAPRLPSRPARLFLSLCSPCSMCMLCTHARETACHIQGCITPDIQVCIFGAPVIHVYYTPYSCCILHYTLVPV